MTITYDIKGEACWDEKDQAWYPAVRVFVNGEFHGRTVYHRRSTSMDATLLAQAIAKETAAVLQKSIEWLVDPPK